MKVKIYQSQARMYKFAGFKEMSKYLENDKVENIEISINNSILDYVEIYETEYPMLEINTLLEMILEDFNVNHPKDFKGRSLSVSDIVQLNDNYYFCDRFGWKKLD